MWAPIREGSPERGTFLIPQVYKREGTFQVEVYETVGKSEYIDPRQNMN